MLAELTEDNIQTLLAAESLKGPRTWRGQPLADLTRGLKDLRSKVINANDLDGFYELVLLEILRRGYSVHPATSPEGRARRRELLIATDDVHAFRAEISLLQDELSDAEVAEAKRVCDDILGVVDKAQVELEKKRQAALAAAALSQTTTPSTSPASSAPATAGETPSESVGSSASSTDSDTATPSSGLMVISYVDLEVAPL